jgi:hypothetical protein
VIKKYFRQKGEKWAILTQNTDVLCQKWAITLNFKKIAYFSQNMYR